SLPGADGLRWDPASDCADSKSPIGTPSRLVPKWRARCSETQRNADRIQRRAQRLLDLALPAAARSCASGRALRHRAGRTARAGRRLLVVVSGGRRPGDPRASARAAAGTVPADDGESEGDLRPRARPIGARVLPRPGGPGAGVSRVRRRVSPHRSTSPLAAPSLIVHFAGRARGSAANCNNAYFEAAAGGAAGASGAGFRTADRARG